MKTLVCTIATLTFISLSLLPNYRSSAALTVGRNNLAQDPRPAQEEAKPTPTPKSNRTLCVEGDPGACINYKKEIEKECGEAPVMSSQPTRQEYENNSKWLTCMRRAQCWNDRAASLRALEDLCRAGEDKAECVQAKYRNTKIDPEACDKPQSNIFER